MLGFNAPVSAYTPRRMDASDREAVKAKLQWRLAQYTQDNSLFGPVPTIQFYYGFGEHGLPHAALQCQTEVAQLAADMRLSVRMISGQSALAPHIMVFWRGSFTGDQPVCAQEQQPVYLVQPPLPGDTTARPMLFPGNCGAMDPTSVHNSSIGQFIHGAAGGQPATYALLEKRVQRLEEDMRAALQQRVVALEEQVLKL
jgi:hypothetical protein